MLCGGSRASVHLLDHRHPPTLGAKVLRQSSFVLRPCLAKSQQPMKSSSSRSHCKTPAPLDCFSQGDVNPKLSAEGLFPVAGGIVALGKFDALHIGHRELAIQAARIGTPYLLSFVGMAEVLGWKPRAPIVAKCDRKRVLSSWASYCGNVAPAEFEIEFASVRHLNPQQFVEKLSRELRVCGVVAGENYRFGYRASGDASELVRLCKEYGISAYIINSVMDKNQVSGNTDTEEDSKSKERGQVSSTRVRHALAAGDVRYVTELLGRPHRVISRARTQDITSKGRRISLKTSSLRNLPPGNGVYKACSLIVGDKHPISCKVVVDTSNINIETEDVEERFHNSDGSQEYLLLGIEFD
ncbi:FAD synthetase [Arabidopsis thaliana x Arabidopsis arenosa]|uniref:FAD synthase n=1 Tax=Arabidopsis thaliana x Arabidopsis arenosa TaxID=1240361 RepID=A0A8T1YYH6_9BRAS|nr:FAD synthetase [Arabidopsis thaliana x Arabidopsis arenosa]